MNNQSVPRSTVIPELAYADVAAAFGARILRPPTTFPYGERQYTVEDPGGHLRNFTQSVADVRPEEWGGVSGALD